MFASQLKFFLLGTLLGLYMWYKCIFNNLVKAVYIVISYFCYNHLNFLPEKLYMLYNTKFYFLVNTHI